MPWVGVLIHTGGKENWAMEAEVKVLWGKRFISTILKENHVAVEGCNRKVGWIR